MLYNQFNHVPNLSPHSLLNRSNIEVFLSTLNQRLTERAKKTWLEQNPMRFHIKMQLTQNELNLIYDQLIRAGWNDVDVKQGAHGTKVTLWSNVFLPIVQISNFSDKLEEWVGTSISNRVKNLLNALPITSFDIFAMVPPDFWLDQPGIGVKYLEEIQQLQYLAKRKVCTIGAIQSDPGGEIAWQHTSKVLL